MLEPPSWLNAELITRVAVGFLSLAVVRDILLHWLERRKKRAESEKVEADTEKVRAEADKLGVDGFAVLVRDTTGSLFEQYSLLGAAKDEQIQALSDKLERLEQAHTVTLEELTKYRGEVQHLRAEVEEQRRMLDLANQREDEDQERIQALMVENAELKVKLEHLRSRVNQLEGKGS